MRTDACWAGVIVLGAIGSLISCDRGSAAADISAIRTEHLHNLEKIPLKGNAALYSGWTLDDEVQITMLYSDTGKPCFIGVSKQAVLIKYRVAGKDGKVFGWQLQPNLTDAGCLLEFASFRTLDEKEGHNE